MAEQAITDSSASPIAETSDEQAPEAIEQEQTDTTSPLMHTIKDGDSETQISTEELIKGYQKTSAGDRKLKEAASMREQTVTMRGQVDSLIEIQPIWTLINPSEAASSPAVNTLNPRFPTELTATSISFGRAESDSAEIAASEL